VLIPIEPGPERSATAGKRFRASTAQIRHTDAVIRHHATTAALGTAVAVMMMAGCGQSPSGRASRTFRVTLTSGSARASNVSTGVVDLAHNALDVTTRYSDGQGAAAGLSNETIAIGHDLWLTNAFARPAMRQILGASAISVPTRPWLHRRTPAYADAAAVLGGPSDPFALLAQLQASHTSRVVGHDTINGVVTTHYLVSTSEVASPPTNAVLHWAPTADLWVDPARYVRQVRYVANVSLGGGSFQNTFTEQFSDFGVAGDIHPPPADQVSEEPPSLTGGVGGSATSTQP